jgi:SAM-dependent methyltransferase
MSPATDPPLHQRDRTPLPPGPLRTGPATFQQDEAFLAAARAHCEQLARHAPLKDARMLDFGCGVGRLYYGFSASEEPELYVGADIRRDAIDWAQANIGGCNRRFRYVWADVHNARYNAGGGLGVGDWRMQLGGPFDLIYANSVLSHMTQEDARETLGLFHDLLADDGAIFVTAFVDDSIDGFQVNPEGFGSYADTPLHVAAYHPDVFEAMLAPRFRVAERVGQGRFRQTIYMLRKP